MTLSWFSIVRLGLVQLCLGAIVVLTTSTLNRLMVVELSMPAVLPGLLVGLHYGIQITRPTWGYRSDMGGRRTQVILLGMACLGLGCLGSAAALVTIAMAGQMPFGGQILLPATIALGLFNGMFAVAAIGSMMALAGEGRSAREGTRMGLWGASQAIAAGFGGLVGAGAVDLIRLFTDAQTAFGIVFMAEAALFGLAALLALHVIDGAAQTPINSLVPGG